MDRIFFKRLFPGRRTLAEENRCVLRRGETFLADVRKNRKGFFEECAMSPEKRAAAQVLQIDNAYGILSKSSQVVFRRLLKACKVACENKNIFLFAVSLFMRSFVLKDGKAFAFVNYELSIKGFIWV
ncbi:MAG: hypothetical protein WCQ55_05265 [Paludibacteraceae bacterium]|nr:hypothetical protein [Prevotellaceae bacterium]